MGINLESYYLYKINSIKALLIRANRPGYNNANQNQENQAEKILDLKIELLLKKYLAKNNTKKKLDFIGMFQGLPEGDVFYKKKGTQELRNLRYTTTRYGKHSIFISIATNEVEFLKIINEEDFADNGLTKEDLILPSIQVNLVDFITENDFDLSSILDAYTFDLENKRLGL